MVTAKPPDVTTISTLLSQAPDGRKESPRVGSEHGQSWRSSSQCSHGREARQKPIFPPANPSTWQLQVNGWVDSHETLKRAPFHAGEQPQGFFRPQASMQDFWCPTHHTSALWPMPGLASKGPLPPLQLTGYLLHELPQPGQGVSHTAPSEHAATASLCPRRFQNPAWKPLSNLLCYQVSL